MNSKKKLFHDSGGFNPKLGVLIPNITFVGNFEEEIANIKFNEKGVEQFFVNHSFIQEDKIWDKQDPSDFEWKDSYYKCPQIASIIDWLNLPIGVAKVLNDKPDYQLPLHNDLDNIKNEGVGDIVRIFVQLNENHNHFHNRFKTTDSDITIQQQKGQIYIFNADTVAHESTITSGTRYRNSLMVIAKRNEWLNNIMTSQNVVPTIIDCKKLAHDKRSKK